MVEMRSVQIHLPGLPNPDALALPSYWTIDERALKVVDTAFAFGASWEEVSSSLDGHLRERGAPTRAVGDYHKQAQVRFFELTLEESN